MKSWSGTIEEVCNITIINQLLLIEIFWEICNQKLQLKTSLQVNYTDTMHVFYTLQFIDCWKIELAQIAARPHERIWGTPKIYKNIPTINSNVFSV